jgi:hypothetical protein
MGAESARSVLAALPLLTWPLLGRRRGAVPIVGHSILVRSDRRMRALALAAAPVSSMAAPAPITTVAMPKAAVAAWPSSTPLA